MASQKAFSPELLSPAGTFKNMKYAFAYGADAVYAGQPRYSLRVRNNDFKLENLNEAINYAHTQGKKFYVATNIAPHNAKVKTFLKDIEPVIAMKPDALIMSDPGLIMQVRENWPDTPIHLSVQSNVVNYASAKFWHKQGIERIILSRELSLEEIEEIRQQCPEIELEVFVHGALCIAYSGRCLLSGYINRRDPNQGTCTNACRWKYQAHEAQESDTGDIIAKQGLEDSQVSIHDPQSDVVEKTNEQSKLFLLQEEGRPEQYLPAYEDEHGTYIMNSKDLRAVQHVKRLHDMGIHSIKIEGRTKSHYYVARTAQVYRQAINDAAAGKDFDMSLMDTLEKLASRGYTEGFLRRHIHDEYQNYEKGFSRSDSQQFVGELIDWDNTNKLATFDVKNRFAIGDQLELMTPSGNTSFKLEHLEGKAGKKVDTAPGSGHQVKIPFEHIEDPDFALLMRNLT